MCALGIRVSPDEVSRLFAIASVIRDQVIMQDRKAAMLDGGSREQAEQPGFAKQIERFVTSGIAK